jgi:hypothetical protein
MTEQLLKPLDLTAFHLREPEMDLVAAREQFPDERDVLDEDELWPAGEERDPQRPSPPLRRAAPSRASHAAVAR